MSKPEFDHSYRRLGGIFFDEQQLKPVRNPQLLLWNNDLAAEIDWSGDPYSNPSLINGLAGSEPMPGTRPIATVYAGHQFGHYNPQLGDGRALLLGEWIDSKGRRVDIQLKGSGPTKYSRGGDGRSPIGPVVREYLVSEAMRALGVPTSRALAAIGTGESVIRNRIEPGAILTRVTSSHLRIGTVQYFASTLRGNGLMEIVDYAVNRHFHTESRKPQKFNIGSEFVKSDIQGDQKRPHSTAAEILLKCVAHRFARLVSRWQVLGFVHGVLNTDNALLCGETIDYGPCAFMDEFNPKACFSSIDRQGRYAWPNQPSIMHWNLAVLAECLIPLLHDDEKIARKKAQVIVDGYPTQFHRSHQNLLASKFGLDTIHDRDQALIKHFQDILEKEQLDYTLSFRWLAETANQTVDHSPLPELYQPSETLTRWVNIWNDRRAKNEGDMDGLCQKMLSVNPALIPRNHLVQKAIEDAESGDMGFFKRAADRWKQPFVWDREDLEWGKLPEEHERVIQTFCGT